MSARSEFVHSTPLPGEGRPDDQWHRDLAQLIRVLRAMCAEDDERFRQSCSRAA